MEFGFVSIGFIGFMKICYFGDFDPTYSRNRVLLRGLKQNGVQIFLCRSYSKGVKKYFDLIKKHREIKNIYDILIVGYSDTRFILPLAKIVSNKKIIWDAFYSLYDAFVFDRKLVHRYSPKAFFYWFLDWINCVCADKILLDTNEHIKYFCGVFNIKRDKFIRVFIGVDDRIFRKDRFLKCDQDINFLVLFWGKFIPLQGVQHIVKAAKLLEKYREIKFQIIGSGQTYKAVRSLAYDLEIKNINFINRVNYEQLPEYIQDADLCLGIFGDTEKTKRVIPNKVYEAIAMGKPVITGDTPAIKELFHNEYDVSLCEIADPEDLADKILKMKNDGNRAKRIGEKGYELFHERATPKIIVRQLLTEIYALTQV